MYNSSTYNSLILIYYFVAFSQLIIFSNCVNTKLKYVWGDALEDPLAPGPDGQAYPWDLASKIATKQRSSRSMNLFGNGNDDHTRINSQNLISPQQTRQILLNAFMASDNLNNYNNFHYSIVGSEGESENGENFKNITFVNGQGSLRSSRNNNNDQGQSFRQGRVNNSYNNRNNRNNNRRRSKLEEDQVKQQQQQREDEISSSVEEGCVPSRLCPSTYNTTAPLYGISLTSGKPVTIVQQFPDLLQQVVFQVCKTTECEVLQGECVQTYLPYLFLVLPLGPVTLTGQDYILVESGCVCQPKYAKKNDQPSAPIPFIQPLNP